MSTSFDALFQKDSAPEANEPVPQKSAGTSFDDLFPSAAPVSTSLVTPQKAGSGTSFDALFTPDAHVRSFDAANSATSFDDLFKRDTINPLTSLSDKERQQSSRPDPENNEDEPWYSSVWSWMNKPLWDLHQYGTRTGAGPFERGIESGAEDIISGLTSPLSLALTVGTFGGDAAISVGASGLRALGVSAEAAPYVVRGVKSLTDLGFTGQAVSSLMTQSPAFLDALKDGDYERAARLGTNILAVGGMTALGASKTFEDAGVVRDAINGKTASKIESLQAAKKVAGKLDLANTVAGERAKALANDLKESIKAAGAEDPVTQGAIVHYLEAQGDLNLLKHQYDALAGALPVKQTPDIVTTEANPTVKDFGSQKNFEKFVSDGHAGDIEDAKRELAKQFDAAQYTDQNGAKVVIPVKPIDQIPTKLSWDNNYVYHAVDEPTADPIRNSGIRRDKLGAGSATPEEAIERSPLPASGDRADQRVFAVPRAEAEAQGDRNILPSHEVVMYNGKPTGQVEALRPDSPYSLTLDRSRFEAGYSESEKDALLAQYEAAQKLTPEQIALANRLRQFYSDQFDRASQAGIIRQAVEAYHPRAWATDRPGFFDDLFNVAPTENPALNRLRHEVDGGKFDTSVSAAKHRAFETRFQGEAAGLKSEPTNLASAAATYQNNLDRAIAARQFLDDMRASGAKASDGRPLVALSGNGKVLGQESGNPALLVNPNAVRGIAISNDIVKAMMQRGELEDLVDSGTIEKLPFNRTIKDEKGNETKIPAYAWSTDGYQTIDHPSMRDWQYIGQDTAGNDAILKANMRVHPEVADYVKQVVGADRSAIRANAVGRAALKISSEAKGTLLALSPFHAVQEGLRGAMVALGSLGHERAMAPWADWSPMNVENDPLLQLGVKNNLTLGSDYRAESDASEGLVSHSKIIGKIPGANRIQDQIQRLTFDKIIPGLKARAFKSVFYRFLDKMPGASADEVAHEAATYVNDVFGGQHWRDLGVNSSTQDIMRLAALAPDWLTSESRMLLRAAGGMGKTAADISRQDMLRLTAGLYMTARVLNLLATGHPHPEAPLGIVVPGQKGEDDKVYSMRTLPTDLIHAMSDPRGFIAGRVNPLTVRPATEFLTGRNERGQRLPMDQFAEDTVRNIIPIGVQGLLKGNIPEGPSNIDQIAKAAGATVNRYRTEAEKLAAEKASDHTPTGPVDPDELAKHQRNILLEDGLRNGEISRGQIMRLVSQREAGEIIQNARLTPLQARFNRLPMKDALDVWSIATPAERDQLHSLLWKKRLSYIQSHTPIQRAADPTWRKIQSVYADLRGRP